MGWGGLRKGWSQDSMGITDRTVNDFWQDSFGVSLAGAHSAECWTKTEREIFLKMAGPGVDRVQKTAFISLR